MQSYPNRWERLGVWRVLTTMHQAGATRSQMSGSVEGDHSSNIAPIAHILISFVDLVEAVGLGNELV